MSKFNEIIGRVVSVFEDAPTIDQKSALQSAKELILQDEEATDQAVSMAAQKAIKDRATAHERKVSEEDARQLAMIFKRPIRNRYAVDTDGRVLKLTSELSRLEWRRIIAIREKQLADDAAQLQALKERENAFGPLWDVHPHLTYREVERLWLSRQRKAS